MTSRNKLIFLLVTVLAACTGTAQGTPAQILSYEDCVKAGHPIRKSMPPSCVTPDGIVFESKRDELIAAEMCKNLCGDGQCQEIVCMGSGCPCPETSTSCPQDCK